MGTPLEAGVEGVLQVGQVGVAAGVVAAVRSVVSLAGFLCSPMARDPAAWSPLGRFVGGACTLLAGAGGGTAMSVVAADTSLSQASTQAAAGILAALSAYAGVSSAARGAEADAAADTLEGIVARLEVLMRDTRALREVFGAGDAKAAIERLGEHTELREHLEREAAQREGTDEEYRRALSNLLDAAIRQEAFQDDALDALAGLQHEIAAIRETQLGDSAKLARILELAEQRHTSDEDLKAQIRAQVEAEFADKLSQERSAREAAERAAEAVLDVRGVEGIEADLRARGGQAIVDALLARATPGEAALAETHRKVAEWAYLIGNIEQAERSLGILLAIDRDDLDANNSMGHIHRLRGHLDRSEASYRRVLELAGDDRGAQAAAIGNLGLILEIRGDLDGAEAMLRRALVINERIGRRDFMANAYGNLGLIFQTRGDLDDAEAMHRKALAIDEELGRREGMANHYGNLGAILKARGDLDGADAMCREARASYKLLGRREVMAIQYGNLGVTLRIRGDLDGAEAMLRAALAIDDELGRREGMASHYGNLGVVFQVRGDLDVAEAMLRTALAIDEELGRREGMASRYGNLGVILRIRGDLEGAEAMLRKNLAIEEELGRREGMANNHANLGSIAKQRGNAAEARRLWMLARDLYAEIGAEPNRALVQGWLNGLDA